MQWGASLTGAGLAKRTKLWGDIILPDWDRERFYRLFLVFNLSTATKFEEDEFARLLMVLIAVHADRIGWSRTFAQHRIDPEEAAARVIQRMITKSRTMTIRKPCPLVVVDLYNRAIQNELITVQRDAVKVTAVHLEQSPEDFDRKDETYEAPDLSALNDAMRSQIDVICPAPHLRRVYRTMCSSVMKGKGILPLEKMPPSIRDRITADEFLDTSFCLNQVINRFAEDLSAQVA